MAVELRHKTQRRLACNGVHYASHDDHALLHNIRGDHSRKTTNSSFFGVQSIAQIEIIILDLVLWVVGGDKGKLISLSTEYYVQFYICNDSVVSRFTYLDGI